VAKDDSEKTDHEAKKILANCINVNINMHVIM